MTGRIAVGPGLQRGTKQVDPLYRGANQTGLRAANERLVLSLIRLHGQLSKGQIADITGLTAQTASVIVRSLEADGFLLRGSPVRGKIGQPSIPMSLDPAGAFFVGLRLCDHGAEIAVVDFLGHLQSEWRDRECHPTFVSGWCAALTAATTMLSSLDAGRASRVQGLGIAMSAPILAEIGEPGLDTLADDVAERLRLPVYIQNEAVAACSAEVIHGLGCGLPDFLFLHVGETVGGGLVQKGQLQFAASHASPDIGRMLVPAEQGRLVRLAGMAVPRDGAKPTAQETTILAQALACAIQAASAVMRLDAVIIDGVLSTDGRRQLVQQVRGRLQDFDNDRLWFPIREGTSQHISPALGAACLPLLSRFFADTKRAPAAA